MYHLPLLPGYGLNANVRSSVPVKMRTGKSFITHLSEAEENGYQGTYFPAEAPPSDNLGGYISSSSPINTRKAGGARRDPAGDFPPPDVTDTETETETETAGFVTEPEPGTPQSARAPVGPSTDVDPGAETDPGTYQRWRPPPVPEVEIPKPNDDDVAEVVFFEYGVVVFFGLSEREEKDILEDIDNAGIMKRQIQEGNWEIEECHYTVGHPHHSLIFRILILFQHDPHIAYPRIYNDFFSEFASFFDGTIGT